MQCIEFSHATYTERVNVFINDYSVFNEMMDGNSYIALLSNLRILGSEAVNKVAAL